MTWVTESLHSLYDFLTGAALWVWVGQTFLRIVAIIILAFVFKYLGNKVIEAVFKNRTNMPIRITTSRREQTLKNLLSNMLSYIIVFIVIMMILDTFHIPIKTMLAGAGVRELRSVLVLRALSKT